MGKSEQCFVYMHDGICVIDAYILLALQIGLEVYFELILYNHADKTSSEVRRIEM